MRLAEAIRSFLNGGIILQRDCTQFTDRPPKVCPCNMGPTASVGKKKEGTTILPELLRE